MSHGNVKLTAEMAATLITLAREGMARLQAAKHVGISHRQLCRWLNDEDTTQPKFAAQYLHAEMEKVREVLPEAIRKEPWTWLARRFPSVWGKRRDEPKQTSEQSLDPRVTAWLDALEAEKERTK